MIHEMRLATTPFNIIKEGIKKVELRLYDEKRRTLDIGDTIVFSEISDEEERIAVIVKALYRYRSFEELFAEIPLTECGFTKECSIAEAIEQMHTYYSKEEEYQYGVLGIKVELSDLQVALTDLAKVGEVAAEKEASENKCIADEIVRKWDEIKLCIKNELNLSEISFDGWLKPLLVIEFNNRTLKILVPQGYSALIYIEKKFYAGFKHAILEVTGIDCNIAFISLNDNTEETKPVLSPIRKIALNSTYTFDNFIVAKSNSFTYNAIQLVAKEPGSVHNPVYLYGKPGLGKTHLLHSIANYIVQKEPEKRVFFTTADEFARVLINNMSKGPKYDLRGIINDTDVFLLDDIQFLAGKESTQIELYHVFEELCRLNKQIVITSDRSPKKLFRINSSIFSFFSSGGLVCKIYQPDFETRLKYLYEKQCERKYDVSEEVMEYIADSITGNFYKLSGALNRVVAYATMRGKKVNVKLAENALKDLIPEKRTKNKK